MSRAVALLTLWSAVVPALSFADDYWDLATIVQCVDDASTTCNQLAPGVTQVHDLEGTPLAPDRDWMVVESKARRSYEVDVRGASVVFGLDPVSCPSCASVARVDGTGLVLTQGISVDGAHPFVDTSVHSVVRWVAGATNQRDWILVGGDTITSFGPNDRYEVVMRDTTLAVPRWNNSASQSTVFLVSNQSPAAVSGSIFFYNGTGTLLHTQPVSVPVFGLQVFATAGIGALAGQSGSATVAHDGGYGALAGKAVALEPATGFTFDTAMTSVPY